MNVVDTNVYVYFYDYRDTVKHRRAVDVITQIRPLLLPWQVGCEFIAACRKLEPFGFTNDMAWRAFAEIQAAASDVAMPSPIDWTSCRHLQQQDMLSFWDALLLATCIRHGVTTIYTEDFGSPRMIRGINVVNPFS